MALNKDQKKTIFIGLTLLFIFYLMAAWRQYDIDSNPKYTIGYVYEYMNGASQGPAIFYYYFVDGIKYKNSNSIEEDYNPRIGEFYWVKYSFKNPDRAQIEQSRRVLDTTAILKAGFSLPKKKRNQFREDTTLK